MPNLKQLRLRIKSIRATQKVTKAMQLVAAAKLRKAKELVIDSALYNDAVVRLTDIVNNIVDIKSISDYEKSFFTSEDSKPILFVIFTSERGLCGSCNSSVIRNVRKKIDSLLLQHKKVQIILIGKKGHDALKKNYSSYIIDYLHHNNVNSEFFIAGLSRKIMALVAEQQISQCVLYFNRFYSVISSEVQEYNLFPINIAFSEMNSQYVNYEYEGAGLLINAIKLYFNSVINYVLSNSYASEQGTRMVAMDGATKNANKMIDSLTLDLNRKRQTVVTKELVEIISGAELV